MYQSVNSIQHRQYHDDDWRQTALAPQPAAAVSSLTLTDSSLLKSCVRSVTCSSDKLKHSSRCSDSTAAKGPGHCHVDQTRTRSAAVNTMRFVSTTVLDAGQQQPDQQVAYLTIEGVETTVRPDVHTTSMTKPLGIGHLCCDQLVPIASQHVEPTPTAQGVHSGTGDSIQNHNKQQQPHSLRSACASTAACLIVPHDLQQEKQNQWIPATFQQVMVGAAPAAGQPQHLGMDGTTLEVKDRSDNASHVAAVRAAAELLSSGPCTPVCLSPTARVDGCTATFATATHAAALRAALQDSHDEHCI